MYQDYREIDVDIEAQQLKAEILRLIHEEKPNIAEERLAEVNKENVQLIDYLKALICLSRKQDEEAVLLLTKVSELAPDDAVVLANLAIAQQRSGDLNGALSTFNKTILLKPDYQQAKYNLACAYLETEAQKQKALELFNELVREDRENAEYLCARADCLRLMNRWPQALRQYLRVLRLDKNHLRTNINLAPVLLNMGRIEQAIECSRQAIEIDSKQVSAYKNLGDALLANEELEEGMDAYADAFELDSENEALCIAIAHVWFEVNNNNEAGFWFQKALAINPDSIHAKSGLARISQDLGDNLFVIESVEPLLKDEPDNIELRMTLSDALWEEGDAEAAIGQLREVLAIQPNRVATHAKIGQLLSSAGDVDAAIKEYETALSQQKNNIPALSGMANTQRGKLVPEYAWRMESILERPKLREGAKASLHNGLGFYYDGLKDYAKAAEHIAKANALQWSSRSKRGWEYEPEKQKQHVDALINTFNREFFEKTRGWGIEDETPVFVVGMPRSGTTLTEQIMARHEKVLGIGERNFASQAFMSVVRTQEGEHLERLYELSQGQLRRIGKRYLSILEQQKIKAKSPEVTRVVDKMPDNYSLVGWIAILFPNARIIHIKRDHRDVALSSWMTQFGAIRWACHTEHLVERFRQYRRIMQHWRDTIPERFMEINYEDLVSEQEVQSKALIDYLGLEWDENCLKFYESDRLVRTASVTQVRQPIYKKSVAKWKHYESLIPELFDPLTEMIESKPS